MRCGDCGRQMRRQSVELTNGDPDQWTCSCCCDDVWRELKPNDQPETDQEWLEYGCQMRQKLEC